MYHISDLKKFAKCPRLYYLDSSSKTPFNPYLRSDESYLDLLKESLGIKDCFVGKVGDANQEFFDNKEKYLWFSKVRFEIGKLRIKVPLMKKNDDGTYDIYYTYYGTIVRDIDFFSNRICVEVLEKLGLIVNEIYIVSINPEYVYKGKIEPDKLFVITNRHSETRIINMILDSVADFDELIHKMDTTKLEDYKAIKIRACHLRGICDHYKECFKDEEEMGDDSILTLVSSQYKNKMFEEGITKLKDVDLERLEGNRVQYAQIAASKNNGLFCDSFSLKSWLENIIEGPKSFIDFEWDRYLIPSFENMKPLDVIPFEFALYIDNGKDELEHKTFISSGDCRREFVKELIISLPKEGPIFAYNAAGAEILRLKELIRVFPEYEEELNKIISRFYDLAIPFVEGIVYDTRMAGVYSLKRLVSVVSDKTYKDLKIDDGMQAVFSWRDVDKGKDEDENKTVEDLKKYCSLDAYALYLVYKWLKGLVK